MRRRRIGIISGVAAVVVALAAAAPAGLHTASAGGKRSIDKTT